MLFNKSKYTLYLPGPTYVYNRDSWHDNLKNVIQNKTSFLSKIFLQTFGSEVIEIVEFLWMIL